MLGALIRSTCRCLTLSLFAGAAVLAATLGEGSLAARALALAAGSAGFGLAVMLSIRDVQLAVRHEAALMRQRAGLCPGCGFAASGGRCPECGRGCLTTR